MARKHHAAASRILVGGFAVASTLGIMTAMAVDAPVAGTAAPVVSPPTVPITPPPTIVRQVYRYVPVPSGGGGSVGGTGATSGGSRSVASGPSGSATPAAAAPVAAPAPAPAPATVTRGS